MGRRKCRYVSALSMLSAGLIWPLDAWLDVTLFQGQATFLEAFLTPAPGQAWMRFLAILLFLILALAYRRALAESESRQSNSPNSAGPQPFVPTFDNRRYVEEQTKLRALAYRDYLTGLYNRRRIEELLEAMYRTEQLKHGGLAVLFCDIDHFKRVNTRFGHPAGDEVLTKLADVFRKHFRRGDAVGRWGGEEFMIILANLTQNEAEDIAEALRKRVENETFPHVDKLTISIGVAMLQRGEDVPSLVARADQALRRAKMEGRNCWHTCEDSPAFSSVVVQ